MSTENAATLWDDLVTAAVIGTDRRPFAAGADAGGRLGEAVSQVRERGLLATAAVVWAYREVGRQVPVTDLAVTGQQPSEAPQDDRPLFTPGAVRALTVIVDDRRFRPVLDEWLALAVQAGGRLPGEAVPKLLDAVRAHHRPAAAAVVGPLASWLGERNPNWEWAHEVATAALPAGPELLTGRDEAEIAAVAAFRDADAARVGAMAASIPAPWSAAVTVAGLEAMARILERTESRQLPGLRELLPHLALVIDPAQSGSISALLSSLEKIPEKQAALRIYWAAPLANFATIASFRASLHKEFQ